MDDTLFNSTNKLEENQIGIGYIPDFAPKAAHNPKGLDALLRAKGVLALHYRSYLNADKADAESPQYPTFMTKYGVLFWSIRPTRVVPQSVSLREQIAVQGMYSIGSMVVNVLGNYLDSKPNERAYYQANDLLVLPDITEVMREVVEPSKICPGNILTAITRYQPLEVLFAATTNNQILDERDYYIHNRQLVFRSDLRGKLVSVVYTYNPVWIVSHLIHNLRLLQANNSGSGLQPTETFFAPQQLICKQSMVTEEKLTFHTLEEYPQLAKYRSKK